MARYNPHVFSKTVGQSAEEDAALIRFVGGISSFLSKVASTLAGRTVDVNWVDPSSEMIAFTDGDSIFLNPARFVGDFMAAIRSRRLSTLTNHIATLKGAAYHELGHIMFTPRTSQRPLRDISQTCETLQYGEYRHYWWTFNGLEDARMESLFVARYRPARKYFLKMVAEFISNPNGGSSAKGMAWVLMHGRKFIPSTLVKQARIDHEQFLRDNGLSLNPNVLAKIIDEYRTLVFPADADRAVELVNQAWAYLKPIFDLKPDSGQFGSNGYMGNPSSSGTPSGDHGGMTKGSAISSQVVKEIMSSESFEDSHSDDDDSDDTDGDGSGNGSSDDADDSEDTEGTGNADSGTDDESDDDNGNGNGGEGSADGDGGCGYSSKSTSSQAKFKPSGDTLRDLESLADVTGKEISAEASSDLRTITKKKVARDGKPQLGSVQLLPVDGSMKVAVRKITEALAAIKADGEDIWERQQAHGKFNSSAAMNARGTHFDVFDQWIDLGDDATSIEVVILLDQSLSMMGPKQQSSSAAMWCIRSAFAALDIPVTVLGYDTSARMLFRPTDKVMPNAFHEIAARGNTDPDDAIDWAYSILAASQAQHKLLFSLTDGEWVVDGRIASTMDAMKKIGVRSTLVMIGAPSLQWRSDGTTYIHSYKYEPVPSDKYRHDRVLKVGDVKQELTKAVGAAITEIAAEVTRNSR